jgi:hypothetical protein
MKIGTTNETKLIKTIQNKLLSVPGVVSYDSDVRVGEDPESWKVGLCIVHVLESAGQLEALLQEFLKCNEAEAEDILVEIQTQVRHIQWHIQDTKFFS